MCSLPKRTATFLRSDQMATCRRDAKGPQRPRVGAKLPVVGQNHTDKGTGRARQGSRRAPNHVGGGVVHGPRPRSC